MLKVFNNTARYIDQGGGRRNGSFAIYIEPHHADIEEFLEMKKNHGEEELRARDLFYGLWISDLFMERVKNNKLWSLFCPDSAPGLSDCYGNEYNKLYEKYVNGSHIKCNDVIEPNHKIDLKANEFLIIFERLLCFKKYRAFWILTKEYFRFFK